MNYEVLKTNSDFTSRNITLAIQAGGFSERMGQDKALLPSVDRLAETSAGHGDHGGSDPSLLPRLSCFHEPLYTGRVLPNENASCRGSAIQRLKQVMKRYYPLFFLVISMVLLFTSCIPQQPQQVAGYVDLTALQPIQAPTQDVLPLRVAVASVISPKGTIQSYEPLLRYLEEQFHRPVELIQRRTYLETNELIAEGKVDLAFVCTSAYVDGHDEFGMELLAAPQVNGETVYYSYLIVPKDSPAQSMEDLEGKVFAFTDPISLSGRMYPTYLVQQIGFSPESFFAQTFFTYNHDEAIRAVANRLADGAAVDSLVYEFAIARDADLANKVKVIHRSPPFGIPPVVVSPKLDPDLKRELQKVILGMEETEEGIKALASIGIEKFTTIDDHAYDDVRNLLSDVEKTR